MGSVTTLSSGSSLLEARLRRESRKSRILIRNARQNLDDYNQQKHTEDTNSKVPKIMTKTEEKNDSTSNPSEEISSWLETQREFVMRCYRTKFGVLESNVSKFADKFDPISSLDDEFYEYTGW